MELVGRICPVAVERIYTETWCVDIKGPLRNSSSLPTINRSYANFCRIAYASDHVNLA